MRAGPADLAPSSRSSWGLPVSRSPLLDATPPVTAPNATSPTSPADQRSAVQPGRQRPGRVSRGLLGRAEPGREQGQVRDPAGPAASTATTRVATAGASRNRPSTAHVVRRRRRSTWVAQPCGLSQVQPAQPVDGVADRPDRVPGDRARRRPSRCGARVLGQLRGDRGDPGEHQPQPANAAPKATEPVTGVPCAMPAAATTTPMARLAPTATVSTAATSGADRPTTPAISSSVRPASSSARVRRITVKMAIKPIMVAADRADPPRGEPADRGVVDRPRSSPGTPGSP